MRRLASYLSALVLCLGALFIASAGHAQPAQLSPESTALAIQQAAPLARDMDELARLYSSVLLPPGVANLQSPSYQQGRVDTFWVARQRPPDHFQSDAVLRRVGRHAYWYVERGFDVSDDALRQADDVFESRIYPRIRQLVGSEPFPGIDNDARVTIFSGNVPDVAGYVTSSDSYARSVQQFSNERDMVYMNLRAGQMGSPEYMATLAHEFTHLVHWNTHSNEDTWIKEGLGDLAITLVFPERQLSSGGFSGVPDLQLTSWSDGEAGSEPLAPHYQQSSWFLRYFVDRYGEDALYPLLARETRGPASFDAALAPAGSSFLDLFRDWVVANVAGAKVGPSIKPYASARPDVPRIQQVTPPQAVAASVAQFGVDYYELPTAPGASLRFSGATTVPVVGTSPYEGDGMWYGGRADSSVSAMTRRVDLTSVDNAVLRYATWFDLEQDYDYLYVSASRDGAHWTLLDTPNMARPNSSGNNLGTGYTGRSSGGANAQWIEDSVDLAPYAGAPVWIRFSYVTDDAVLREGAVLDDVRVEGAGYFDGAESDSGGWDLEGWTRVGGRIPQDWMVQAIEWKGGMAEAHRLDVDAAGRATWSPSSGDERAVLAVSGAAPVTLQRAQYNVDITP